MQNDENNRELSDRVIRGEFEALLSAAVDGIVVIDNEGRIEEFNQAAEKLFGYTRDDVLGQDVSMLMPEPTRSAHAGYLDTYLRTRRPHIIGSGREVEGRRRDGSTFPLWLSVGEAHTDSGQMFVGIIRDVSAQHDAQARHAELESRLAHVGRFSLMGEMAGGIAHEINQPLSAIATYAQAGRRLLESQDYSIEELQTICGRIAEQSHRAASVIENLRSFIRKQEPTQEPLNVNRVIGDILEIIQLDAKNGDIRVHLELERNLPRIMGNDIQIQQVVLNLTRNAVDAMRNSPASARERGIVVKTCQTQDGQIAISVADHGPGVAKGLNEAVFNPFVSTKGDGLGVGLAISKTIIESHGGTIGFRSARDGGAIFEAKFPLIELPDTQ